MKSIILIKLFILLIVIISIGGYFYYRQLSNRNANNDLIRQIENWNLYQEITDSQEKNIACDCTVNKEYNDLNVKIKEGSVKRLMLNNALPLLITPNYFNWSNNKFLSFNNDSTAVCCVVTSPLKAYQDKLLWRGGCSTGAIPSENTLAYKNFLKCLQAEAVLEEYFK